MIVLLWMEYWLGCDKDTDRGVGWEGSTRGHVAPCQGTDELIVETGISTLACQCAPRLDTGRKKQEGRGKGCSWRKTCAYTRPALNTNMGPFIFSCSVPVENIQLRTLQHAHINHRPMMLCYLVFFSYMFAFGWRFTSNHLCSLVYNAYQDSTERRKQKLPSCIFCKSRQTGHAQCWTVGSPMKTCNKLQSHTFLSFYLCEDFILTPIHFPFFCYGLIQTLTSTNTLPLNLSLRLRIYW